MLYTLSHICQCLSSIWSLFDCRRERTYFFELFLIKTKVQILRPTRRVSDTHNVSLQMWPWPGRMGTILGPLLGQSARWQTTLMWPWLGHLLPACTSISEGGDFGYATLVNGDGQGLGQVISIPFIFKSSTILTLSSCDQPAALPVGDCKHHSHQDHQDIFQLQSVIAQPYWSSD